MNEHPIHDDAVFCLDLVLSGMNIYATSNKIYLCQLDESKSWRNALLSSIIEFPKSDVIDEITGCVYTRIWVGEDDWHSLNLAPNFFGFKAFELIKTMLQVCRDLDDSDLFYLIQSCTQLTYKQAKAQIG